MLVAPMNSRPGEIVITPVANGWMVEIPTKQDGMPDLSGLFKQIKNFKDEMIEDDDILKKIYKDVEAVSEAATTLKKDESIHVFSNFDQVLAFLSNRIKE
jgi:hypothetical protein